MKEVTPFLSTHILYLGLHHSILGFTYGHAYSILKWERLDTDSNKHQCTIRDDDGHLRRLVFPGMLLFRDASFRRLLEEILSP